MYHFGASRTTGFTSRYFHCLTLLASTIYLGDVLTWIVLLYHTSMHIFNNAYVWLLILCIVHLAQLPFINSSLDIFKDKLPMNSLTDNGRSSRRRLIQSTSLLSKWLKSFICFPLYPLIYHPFVYSLVTNKSIDDDKLKQEMVPKQSSISIQLNGEDDKYGYENNHYHKYQYTVFWKLFGFNNIFALIRSLFLICIYDSNSEQNDYIWFLSLVFTLSSVISLFGMLSKLISHNQITFIFRWLCFSAFYLGCIISLRWITYLNTDNLDVLMLPIIKFILIKIIVFSAPFSVWLGFRKIYLNSMYHNYHFSEYLTNIIQCIVSCIFYIFVWECCSFLFYFLGYYPKHYKHVRYWSLIFQWISPYISSQHVLFRIIAFNYYILSKMTALNQQNLDESYDIWKMSKYLCKHSKKCNKYYRLVTFEGLRQCLSFSLIDLILWHYNSSNNHHLIINNTTFSFLHLWLQQSFFITFIFHLFSMFLTICIPTLLLLFVSSIYVDLSEETEHADCGKEIDLNGVEQMDYDQIVCCSKLNWSKMNCLFSQWRLESALTAIYTAMLTGILGLLPYILKFKYLISHFYSGLDSQQSLIDERSLFEMINEAERYYRRILEAPIRDKLLKEKFGEDVASIILQYLPSL